MFPASPKNPAFEIALKLLNKKALSTKELTLELDRQELPSSQIDNAIEHLKALRYLDDESIGTRLLQEAHRKKRGWLWLRKKLLDRKIDEAQINHIAELAQENEYSNARENLRKKLRAKNLSRTQAFRFLLNRGFELELVEQLIQQEYNQRVSRD
tara:strand:- start:637 stop:1101 length:465 start_codon:yes stop_codon:yes gene_type:complete